MALLLVGAAILGLLVWTGRRGRKVRTAPWRVSSAILSTGLFAAAAFEGLRGGAESAGLLLVGAIVFLALGRWPRRDAATRGDRIARQDAFGPAAMSLAEARATLGVEPEATPEAIRAAHARLIRIAHPDRGGTAGLAAQLNAARDRLLKG
ncbi:MAG: molecular chaperone DnaJ [Caulobacteraceae bacterium]|nr:molecular chaperone DnaJ [Caulobacteraceae bacterium]